MLALAIATIGPAWARAASQSPSGQSSSQSDQVAQGVLMSVDTTNQTLTIKDANDQEMQFQYNSSTKVEGNPKGVQGLSSETGTRLRVHYKQESGQRLATWIEVIKS
jgi:hypothetical protein